MADYISVVTTAGAAKVASSIANGTPIQFSHIVAGDGNGAPITPAINMTGVVREVWRGAISNVSRDPLNPNQVIIEAVIPDTAGPFTIREIAVLTSDGVMFAIGNYPDAYKPSTAQGAVVDVTVLFYVAVSPTANVTVQIMPDIFLALHRGRVPFLAVDSTILNAPPPTPALGATYVLPVGCSGAWVGQDNNLAQWTGLSWAFSIAPVTTIVGLGDSLAGALKYIQRTHTGWVPIDLSGGVTEIEKMDFKRSVKCATTGNITLSGLPNIDGYQTIAGDRVLVRTNTNAAENGIWVAVVGSWVRSSDASDGVKLTSGTLTFVEYGTLSGSKLYALSSPDPITVGTTLQTWIVIGGISVDFTVTPAWVIL